MPAPVRVALAVVAALACALPVAGCGTAGQDASAPRPSSSPSPPAPPLSTAPAPSATPAAGATVTGSGYAFRLPRGWRDVTAKLRNGSGVDRAAGAITAVGGFRSNVNVVVTTGGLTEQQVAMVTHNIRDRMRADAPHYAVLPATRVAGSPAGHLAGLRTRATHPYWLEQYVVGRAGHAYIVSFSFSPKVSPHERRTTIDSILASWRWR